MIIALDVDGVLLDYAGSLDLWMRSHFSYMTPAKQNIYALHERYNIPHLYMEPLANLFAESEHFRTLSPYRNAIPNVRKLYEAGHRLVAVTACNSTEITKKLRYENLEARFGNAISEVHFVGVDRPKREVLAKLRPDAFVDDLPEHIITAPNDTKKFLMEQPWNLEYRRDTYTYGRETIIRATGDNVITNLNLLVDKYAK